MAREKISATKYYGRANCRSHDWHFNSYKLTGPKKLYQRENYKDINKPNKEDPIDVIAKVGGFDLAGMVGVYLGAAYYKIPVVIDGFISAIAALVASKLCKYVIDYLIPSHMSKEIGYMIAMKELGLEPMLNLDMRLGEGSGCPIAFSIVNYACAMMNNMATFEEAEIDSSYLENIKDKKSYIVYREKKEVD